MAICLAGSQSEQSKGLFFFFFFFAGSSNPVGPGEVLRSFMRRGIWHGELRIANRGIGRVICHASTLLQAGAQHLSHRLGRRGAVLDGISRFPYVLESTFLEHITRRATRPALLGGP